MAWSDEPTKAQLNALYNLMHWKVSTPKLRKSMEYLAENKTRKEVCDEMKRVRNLYIAHALTEARCFESKIWKEFEG